MSENDVVGFDRRIAVIGIVGAYVIFLILAALEIIRVEELLDFSDNRRRIVKILMLPIFYAIFLSITGAADFLSEKIESISFLVAILISVAASLLCSYIINFILNPQYGQIYKDFYKVYTFLISLTVPYFAIIIYNFAIIIYNLCKK